MTIRTETATDYAAVFAVHEAAFAQPDEARIVERLRGDGAAFVPELSFVAEMDAVIIGHALFSIAQVMDESGDVSVLALAPVGVLPAYQKRGVGSALIRFGIEQAASLGYRGVVVLGHAAYYPRFGFVPASRFSIVCPFPVPDEAYIALPLFAGALDTVSSTVAYSPAFTN